MRRVSSSSIEYESEGEEETASGAKGGEALSTTHPDTHNPWLEQCHQTTLNKLKQKSQPSNVVGKVSVSHLIVLIVRVLFGHVQGKSVEFM